MNKTITIFGRQIKLRRILFYSIFIVIFSIYSFVEKPFIKSIYLKSDIEYFANNHFWKIYLVIIIFFLLFGFFKIEKSKEAIGGFLLATIFFLIVGYVWLNHFITTQTLFLNQIKSVEKKKVVYQVFNHDKIISLSNKTNEEFIFDDSFTEKIDRKRKMNQQKSLSQLKHGDTINVFYDKGLFGFKYLN